ncbi:MAG: undecaprenyldiphospho-muramoylpentapeptide beta-N-acetylglucosaminyltransferase [Lachnospiraceae bacterium]|nr:undecaprenyldiphospho-muramoylpentapeptide beta-N-acetylglucosaminyltransferase [Lachnospiraceae bacterium]
MKRIVLTGGGTAGHVTPNLALLPGLRERGFEICYIGSYDGIEKKMIEAAGVPYHGISSGKFRRNLDPKNIADIHHVAKGIREAAAIIKEFKPDIVFSKGGYVAVPVVWAAHHQKIPVIIHECDLTPGLANKLSFSSAVKVCCNFPETMSYLPKDKAVLSGSPIRAELLSGDREAGLRFAGFDGSKPVLLMIGGSLGARKLNEVLREALPELQKTFDVFHIAGKGNLDESLEGRPGYCQVEFISAELKDVFAAADIVFSRAGANAICELLALKKPNLLVPLPKESSRGDQILNAVSFEKQGFSMVVPQAELTPEKLVSSLAELYENRETFRKTMSESTQSSGVDVILGLIDGITGTAPKKE